MVTGHLATLRIMPEPPEDGHAAEDSEATWLDDPEYRAAVVDLLGVLGYGELSAFSRLAVDADMAPSLDLKSKVCAMAVAEFHHHELIVQRLRELGADPQEAMQPFVRPIDAFHQRTRPSSWLEGLVKAYVGDGIGNDFYREVSNLLDPSTRALVLTALADEGQAEFVVSVVKRGIRDDRRVAGRLALWGRRLVGEALTQAQSVAVERDALSTLLVGGPGRRGADLAEVGRMFTRLTDAHTRRMGRLGLIA